MIVYLLEADTNDDTHIFSTKEKAIEYIEKLWGEAAIYNEKYDIYICGLYAFNDPTYYIREIEVDK